jgi:hypothetical protein
MGLGAWIQDFDLERAVGDMSLLADPLMPPLLAHPYLSPTRRY